MSRQLTEEEKQALVPQQQAAAKIKRALELHDYLGPKTKEQLKTNLLGASRFFIEDKNFQRVTSGTSPTELDEVLELLLKRPSAKAQKVE